MKFRPHTHAPKGGVLMDLGELMRVAGSLAKRRQEAKALDTPARGGALWALDSVIDDMARIAVGSVPGFNARHFRKTCGQEHIL